MRPFRRQPNNEQLPEVNRGVSETLPEYSKYQLPTIWPSHQTRASILQLQRESGVQHSPLG